ncbi:MAG TPA: glutamine-hydrolyzing GMP synthase [Candidatus Krumholzibacteria bacterium]|nr:glutamine-hydrolyzing GMP synthase [Candidatus Krumholzibacteria bacterium]
MAAHETIVVLDFGAQTTQLIARRVRGLRVHSQVLPGETRVARVRDLAPKGLILSGGPASTYMARAPRFDPRLLELGVPVLGICYGMQLLAQHLGGSVEAATVREFGPATMGHEETALFAGLAAQETVWMNHGDAVRALPPGFTVIGRTEGCVHAAIQDPARQLYGLQFHPEVAHTPRGEQVLANFVLRLCGCRGDWTPENLAADLQQDIRERVGTERVLAAVSGGVDSTVLAVLLHRSLPGQVETLFVDSGLLRSGEADEVRQRYERLGIALRVVDAGDAFLETLAGVEDPEEKRRRIGHTFVRAFEAAVRELPPLQFLAQGTLYPDVIESGVPGGHSTTIKTHHNVGGLPADMPFTLLEPLRDLFKDEVRRLGAELGIAAGILGRHPFPGPGLAVRILGPVTRERLEILRQCDAIFLHALQESGWYERTWQAFAVLLPVQSVGVMGDGRTYENVVALRAVDSLDGMTADWTRLPAELLAQVAGAITNQVRGVNRVVYDISSKPPSTIEWE